MSYRERFFGILRNTLIGWGIGIALSVILIIVTGSFNLEDGLLLLLLGLLIGTIISIVICAKTGNRGFMSSAMTKLWGGMCALFFSGLSGSTFLLVIGIIRLLIGVAIMIPVGLYMVISYFVNFIYLGIMTLVEKFGKIDPESTLCTVLDKISALISVVIVVLICIRLVGVM